MVSTLGSYWERGTEPIDETRRLGMAGCHQSIRMPIATHQAVVIARLTQRLPKSDHS